MFATQITHWSDLYAGGLCDWQHQQNGARSVYYRRLGIVENLFDSDGIQHEGRADINTKVSIKLTTPLDEHRLRERIIYVWALMRHRHVLLASVSQDGHSPLRPRASMKWIDRYFVYEPPTCEDDAIKEAVQSVTFLADHYPTVDGDLFYTHAMNAERVFDASNQLCRLFVFPLTQTSENVIELRLYLVTAHAIADGLTMYRRVADFVSLLNRNLDELGQEMRNICSNLSVASRLPMAQESLYPQRASSAARVRWQWLITRILRHVRRAVPPAFQNPLRRNKPLAHASRFPPKYSAVLKYDKQPPLNSYTAGLDLPKRATDNLIRLCRQAGISRGSGTFVMVAMVMMRLEEKRHPDIPLAERLPFIGSFPLNPRPFLSGLPTSGAEDSVMLAFSDGIVLPFLPSTVGLEPSFRVLGRLADRQLHQYQKRRRSAKEEVKLGLSSPHQLLPALYLTTLEGIEARIRPDKKIGLQPQGQYPATQAGSLATCGISSIGDSTNLLRLNGYNPSRTGREDLLAEWHSMSSAVRARQGEFLVGAVGNKDHQGFFVSFDGSAIDPERVQEWKKLLDGLLDYNSADSEFGLASNAEKVSKL